MEESGKLDAIDYEVSPAIDDAVLVSGVVTDSVSGGEDVVRGEFLQAVRSVAQDLVKSQFSSERMISKIGGSSSVDWRYVYGVGLGIIVLLLIIKRKKR